MSIRTASLGVLLVTGACYSYRPVATAPTPNSRVRIVLVGASDVTTIAADGTRRSIDGVVEVSGTIQAAAADTVAVRLGELRTASGAVPGVAEPTVLLATARIARIEQRQFQAGKTALAGIGLVTIATATFLVVVIAAITRGF